MEIKPSSVYQEAIDNLKAKWPDFCEFWDKWYDSKGPDDIWEESAENAEFTRLEQEYSKVHFRSICKLEKARDIAKAIEEANALLD